MGLGLTVWQGEFETKQYDRWLRWCDRDGNLLLTGYEQAQQARQQTEQARQRAEQVAEQERQRAERLAAFLRSRGDLPSYTKRVLCVDDVA